MQLFNNLYQNKTILVTGHTGFKGAWLTQWLLDLGANVVGYSLPDLPSDPSLFALSGLHEHIVDVRGDIRDWPRVWATVEAYQPDLIFHMAAQPIVLRGVKEPKMTFDANSGGTVNILEAMRLAGCVKGLVSITTDKVYHNHEWLYGYRENDRLGGHDPYSASKAMAELAVAAYRDTFWPAERYAEHGVGIATTRAGNVIGGGDFAEYRLVPDCMRALAEGRPIEVRNPYSIRPWQHVLVPLSGYLALGAKMLAGEAGYSEAWNFGPIEQKGITTGQIAEKLIALWDDGEWIHTSPDLPQIETGLLRLSWDKAASRLDWHPVYTWEDALAEIVAWHQEHLASAEMGPILQQHIANYVAKAAEMGVGWIE